MDYLDLDPTDVLNVNNAINNNQSFYGYIPEEGLRFILKNYKKLHTLGSLEASWVEAYLYSSNFVGIDFETIKEIFDHCNKDVLRNLYPLPDKYGSKNSRISLFRGCSSPFYKAGMSWTTSLDKAIWYAAHHNEFEHYNTLSECSVYASTVDTDEVYCYIDHNEEEFIVIPNKIWKVDIPQSEFRIDRKR